MSYYHADTFKCFEKIIFVTDVTKEHEADSILPLLFLLFFF